MSKGKKSARDFLEELMALPLPQGTNPEILDSLNIPQEQREGLTINEVFWTRLINKALGGDMKAINEVLDRRYGKAPQHILNENRNLTYVTFLESIEKEEIEAQGKQVGSKDVDRGSPKELTLEDLGLI